MNKDIGIGIGTLNKSCSLIDRVLSGLKGFKVPDEFMSYDLTRLTINIDEVEICFLIKILDKNIVLGIRYSNQVFNYKKVKTKIIYDSNIFDLKISDDKWLKIYKRLENGVTLEDVTSKDFAISQNVEENIINFVILFILGIKPNVLSGHEQFLVNFIKKQLSVILEPRTISNIEVSSCFTSSNCSKTIKSL